MREKNRDRETEYDIISFFFLYFSDDVGFFFPVQCDGPRNFVPSPAAQQSHVGRDVGIAFGVVVFGKIKIIIIITATTTRA